MSSGLIGSAKKRIRIAQKAIFNFTSHDFDAIIKKIKFKVNFIEIKINIKNKERT